MTRAKALKAAHFALYSDVHPPKDSGQTSRVAEAIIAAFRASTGASAPDLLLAHREDYAGAYAAFALVSAERARRATGQGREVRVPLSDLAIASLGHLGQIAEAQIAGADRPGTVIDRWRKANVPCVGPI